MGIALRTLAWVSPLLGAALLAEPSLAQEAEAAAEAMGGMAEEATPLDSGDVAWILTSSAIVLMMTIPGLALFYGGLVRVKNVLSILMQCLITLSIVSVIWVLWGYSIAFGPDLYSIIGNPFAHFALKGVPVDAGPGDLGWLNMIFQLMFAAITPALIVGAFAERMKFSAFFFFTVLWSTFVYAPLAHWVWGGGWISQLGGTGALDYAGGTVVHISSGMAALIAAVMIGRRRGYGIRPMPPHNLTYTVVGAALLWVGWFGFNAGSALGANADAIRAFVTTNTATGAAVLAWMFAEWIGRGKPTALGAATGAVAGLVAITPACGFVGIDGALVIGGGAGILCYKACSWKDRVGYDDALDVVGVHGVGGTWGALLTGWFAIGVGGGEQMLLQLYAVLGTYAFVGFMTFLILGIVNATVGLRVEEEDEETGLDLSQHSENAYSSSPGSAIGERPPVRPPTRPAPAMTPRAPSSGVQRTPPTLGYQPVTAPAAAAPAAPTPAPPAPTPAPAAPEPEPANDRPFRVVIDGVDKAQLQRWWRDLCHNDISTAPQAFREIYPNVVSFDGGTYSFRGGDPAGTRERIAYLLDIYGAHGGNVRIEEAA